MKILIVNSCLSNNSHYFKQICTFIKLFLQQQTEIIDTQLEIIIRTKNNLNDYLFQIDSTKSSKQAMKNFENLDILFIVGDNKLHPWSPQIKQVFILIRMCLRLNKQLLLLGGPVFQAFIIAFQSKTHSNIQLVNGNKGSPLSQIKNFVNVKSRKKYFFDSVTGDLYSSNSQNGQWNKYSNCGIVNLHQHRQFYKNQKIKSVSLLNKIKTNFFKTRVQEILCFNKKPTSYLMQGIGNSFVVSKSSIWGVLEQNNFQIIGLGQSGPLIIQKGNIVGIHFQIQTRYLQTVKILKNFLMNRLRKIINQPRDAKSGQHVLKIQKYQPTLQEYPPKQIQYKLNIKNFKSNKNMNEKISFPIKQIRTQTKNQSFYQYKNQFKSLSRNQLIKMLHPNIQLNINRKPIWIPGYLKKNNLKGFNVKSNQLKKKVKRIEIRKSTINLQQKYVSTQKMKFNKKQQNQKKIIDFNYINKNPLNNKDNCKCLDKLIYQNPKIKFRQQLPKFWLTQKGFR